MKVLIELVDECVVISSDSDNVGDVVMLLEAAKLEVLGYVLEGNKTTTSPTKREEEEE